MENLAFLGPLLGISGMAVVVLAIIAVVQDLRQERKYGYRQAFYTIVSLVMLVMVVGSSVSLITIGLKEAMPSAKQYLNRSNFPPAPYFIGTSEKVPAPTTAYTCAADCQFTATDKQNFTDWKVQYADWQSGQSSNQQLRRDLAGSLALFIVALPVFWLFMRWMNRGAKEESQQHQRPSPLRSVYFYGVAFGGLVMAVVGGAMLLNTGLKTILKTGDTNTSIAQPAGTTTSNVAADSMIACANSCGFTADDVAVVNEWKTKNAEYLANQSKPTSSVTNDLATTIPFVVVGLPLFWLHFAKIRKETAGPSTSPVQTV